MFRMFLDFYLEYKIQEYGYTEQKSERSDLNISFGLAHLATPQKTAVLSAPRKATIRKASSLHILSWKLS